MDKKITCSCGHNMIYFDFNSTWSLMKSHWIGTTEKPYTLTVNGKSITYNKLACDKCGRFLDELG